MQFAEFTLTTKVGYHAYIVTEVPIAIDIRNLTRTYGAGDTAVYALRSINLTVPMGRWVGVKGRSGSGKTTLLNCIGGLDRPSVGSVHCFGQNIAQFNDAQLTQWRRNQVGFVFQAFALMPSLSAYENVELPMRIAAKISGKARRERVRECLNLVGLDKWIDHRPNEMSGGQQQRVAIARALVNRPRLLMADEPTGELDTSTAREILSIFRKIVTTEQLTLIMSSHDPMTLEYTDEVLELVDGQIFK